MMLRHWKAGYPAAAKGWIGYWGALWVSLLLTLPVLFRAVPMWQYRYGKRPSWETTDLDTGLIHDGLIQAPHLADTLQWWVGRWVGEVPFYRPLTSYVFWIEWKLFGDQEWWYALPTLAAHMLATVLAAALAYRLAERWKVAWPAFAAVSTAAIFTGLTRAYRMTVVSLVAQHWKNQPDSLATCCCFLALLAYVRAQERDRHVSVGAIGFYVAACCFKEISVPLPVVCSALELLGPQTGRWPRALSRAGLAVGSGLFFLAVRNWAIEGVGYTYGSNTRWFDRSLLEILGPLSIAWPGGYWVGCLVAVYACALAALWWRARPFWLGRKHGAWATTAMALSVFLLGAIMLGVIFERIYSPEYVRSESWDMQCAEALFIFLNPLYPASFLGVLYMAAAATALWKRSRAVVWIAPVWTLAFLAPLAMSPGPIHRYYLPRFGYAFFDAMGCSALLAQLWPVVQGWWSARRALETSGKSAAPAIQ